MEQREEIFLSILENHKGIIYKVANSYCHDRDDQKDLVQEITLQIWQSLENFNDKYKLSTWIFRIALNTSISFYRKNKTRTEKTVDLYPMMEFSSVTEENENDENYILLNKFIRELKEIDKAIILLYLEGLSGQEIADVVATSPTNITSKVSRIKKKLKEKFDNHKYEEDAKY